MINSIRYPVFMDALSFPFYMIFNIVDPRAFVSGINFSLEYSSVPSCDDVIYPFPPCNMGYVYIQIPDILSHLCSCNH